MQINPDINLGAFTIRSYATNEILVYTPMTEDDIIANKNSTDRPTVDHISTLRRPFIIAANKLISDWDVTSPENLQQNSFKQIIGLDIEILLLGTGKQLHFPDPKYIVYVQQHGIGIEVMTTEAACRTYNFLVSDKRKVAAALFMPNQ